VERQRRGGHHFHVLRVSTVIDNACWRIRSRVLRDVCIVERWLVENSRPFGILSMSFSLYELSCIILIGCLLELSIGVLGSLFLDESVDILYFEDEVLLSAVLYIIRGRRLGRRVEG